MLNQIGAEAMAIFFFPLLLPLSLVNVKRAAAAHIVCEVKDSHGAFACKDA